MAASADFADTRVKGGDTLMIDRDPGVDLIVRRTVRPQGDWRKGRNVRRGAREFVAHAEANHEGAGTAQKLSPIKNRSHNLHIHGSLPHDVFSEDIVSAALLMARKMRIW